MKKIVLTVVLLSCLIVNVYADSIPSGSSIAIDNKNEVTSGSAIEAVNVTIPTELNFTVTPNADTLIHTEPDIINNQSNRDISITVSNYVNNCQNNNQTDNVMLGIKCDNKVYWANQYDSTFKIKANSYQEIELAVDLGENWSTEYSKEQQEFDYTLNLIIE